MAHPFGRPETAPMLTLVWGPTLAPVVSTLIVARPVLAQRLVLAPRRVVHAVAAFIHYAVGAQHDPKQIADEIEGQHVRVLLARAVTDPHRRLYRTLGRLGPSVLDGAFYPRLNTMLHGPAADVVLEAEEVTAHHLDLVAEIIADPVLLAARKAIGSSRSDLQHLQHTLVYLRIKGWADDIEKLPPGSGWKAVMRRISSDLGRARAPEVTFGVPAGWRHVASVADLWRVGTAMGNCVASLHSGGDGYIHQLISGDAVYLVRDGKPMMLACIRNVGPNLWTLAETSASRPGPDIVAARKMLREGLRGSIREIGGALLEQSPLSSIQTLAWRGARDTDAEVGGLEDFE